MCKQPPKGPQHDTDGNMGPRMFPGTFVGYHHFSNTYRVANAAGDIVKVRSIMRRPMEDRWNAEQLKSIRTTPWNLRITTAPVRVDMGDRVPAHAPGRDEPVPQARRLKITLQILKDYGTTDGCPQCRHVRLFGESKPGLGHSDACRDRIVEAMHATADGAQRLERQDNRLQRTLLEQSDVEARRGDAHRQVRGGQEDTARSAPVDETPGGMQQSLQPTMHPKPLTDRLSEEELQPQQRQTRASQQTLRWPEQS